MITTKNVHYTSLRISFNLNFMYNYYAYTNASTKSSRSHAWVVEFEDGDTCAVDLRPGWAGHKDSPGQWRPMTYKDLGAELP